MPTSSVSCPIPNCTAMPANARKVGRRFAQLAPIVGAHRQLTAARGDLETARELAVDDASFADEVIELETQVDELETQLSDMLAPRDPHDADDVVLEVKSGEGGEESALFAADLARMYIRYAERHGWTVTVSGRNLLRLGWLQRRDADDRQQGRLGGRRVVAAEIRRRGAPRAAGAGHRIARPRAYFGGRCAGLSRARRSGRGPDRRVGPAHRRLPVVRQGRAGRQHHRLRGANHPPAHRNCRHLPKRAVAAAEQGPRDAGARRPPAGIGGRAGVRPTRRPTGPARSAPWTAANASAPTTSRRTGSPTTASVTRHTISISFSTATSTHCSTPWPPPTSSPGCSRHDDSTAVRDRLGDNAARRSRDRLGTLRRRGVGRAPVPAPNVGGCRCSTRPMTPSSTATRTRSPRDHAECRCSTSPAPPPFGPLTLSVGPGVFIPRPETEVDAGMGYCAITFRMLR